MLRLPSKYVPVVLTVPVQAEYKKLQIRSASVEDDYV
jgi:hypothetical protein